MQYQYMRCDMKRSKIENEIARSKELIAKNNIKLPMFGYWDLGEWRANASRLDTIRRTLLGWDVTDFGSDDFDNTGAVLFTIRNGLLDEPGVGTPYAEKLIIMKEGQVLPLHFHFNKTEDIINRAGGVLMIQLFRSLPDGEVDETGDVEIYTDGVLNTLKAGSVIEIMPGGSITITPGIYHLFDIKKGAGDVVVGEVSAINDDNTDNRFAVERKRFAGIDEDVPVTVPLLNEYEELIFSK